MFRSMLPRARRPLRPVLMLAFAAVLAVAGMQVGATTARAATSLPCDVYASGGTPCAVRPRGLVRRT